MLNELDQLSREELRQHVTIVGWLHIIGNAIFLVLAIFMFSLLIGIGAASGDPEAVRVLSVVGSVVGFLFVALALPGLIAGYGLLRRRPWARILGIVVGFLSLLNVPLGTIIGLYTLFVLMQREASAYFEPPQTQTASPAPTG